MDTAKVLGREYRPHVIDAALKGSLSASGAVVIEGARASGKTMTALRAAASYVFIDDVEAQRLFEVAPRSLLEGEAPRLLDEWQVAPELWNLVRRAVDSAVEPGRFILTGSAVPPDDATRHTVAGRFLRLRERTMSWWEKLDTPSAAVSLSGLFDGELPTADLTAAPDLDIVIDNLLRPGFPAMTALSLTQSADRLRGDLQTLDTLFESAVVHDLTVFASAIGGEVSHYRDSNNKEIDAIITLPDGRWGAVEVKLGGQQLATGANSLKSAIAQVDTETVGDPTFRLVITGTGPILVTDDGTVSAPLSALAP